MTGQGRGWGAGFSELPCRDLTNDGAEVQVSGRRLSWAAPPPFTPVTLELWAQPYTTRQDVGDVTWTLWAGRWLGFCSSSPWLSAHRPPQQRDPTWALWMPD